METIDYKGYEIEIHQDTDPQNPREDFDPLCSMVCFHSRYNLGDKHNFNTPDDFREWLKDNNYKEGKNIFILPLFLYDHSGLTMSTGGFSCPWDSGQVGYIYLTAERFKAECARPIKPYRDGINPTLQKIKNISKKDKTRIYSMLKNEVETYDQYLTGEVYGFKINGPEDENGIREEGLDSCWGFYGPPEDYMIKECKSIIDHLIIETEKQRLEDEKQERDRKAKKLKAYVSNRVPLESRVF